MNINQLVQLMQNSQGNPKEMVLTMLENQGAQNPMLSNLLQMAKNDDKKGIEQFARNLVKERGLDFDEEFNKFKKAYRL